MGSAEAAVGVAWTDERYRYARLVLRYYFYLSSTKVAMLGGQLVDQGRIDTRELQLRLGVVRYKQGSQSEVPGSETSLIPQIEEWIYGNEEVGSVDEPASWIYGRMELAAINFSWYRDDDDEALRNGAVLMGGESAAQSALLLGGSARHIVGNHRFSRDFHGTYSDAVSLRDVLAHHLDDVDDFHPCGVPDGETANLETQYYARLLAAGREGTALGQCEFLAKSLQRGSLGGSMVTLATPLFVAID